MGYSTASSEISDLGATRPPRSIVTHPSADIFNGTTLTTGVMVLAAAVLLRRGYRRRALPYILAVFAVGVIGVGTFHGDNATMRPIAAQLTFIFGGLSCVVASRVTSGPFRYVSAGLGVVTLTFLVLAGTFVPLLGDGGTERWIAYPLVL